MGVYVALGAAEVEADSPIEAAEAAEFEELNWHVRHICTATEWISLQTKGTRPWLGKASWFSLPFIAWTLTTGRVGPWEWWHPVQTVAEYLPFV